MLTSNKGQTIALNKKPVFVLAYKPVELASTLRRNNVLSTSMRRIDFDLVSRLIVIGVAFTLNYLRTLNGDYCN